MSSKQTVIAVSRSASHTLIKANQDAVRLIERLGVEGDAHLGKTIKHRSRVRKDPTQPNLRQVHLIQSEVYAELNDKGFDVAHGAMGENITTEGIDFLSLPLQTILHLGPEARIQITGLRNPCSQLDGLQPGLMSAVLDRDEDGNLIRKSGIMSIVLQGGIVSPGDQINIELPEKPHLKLEKV